MLLSEGWTILRDQRPVLQSVDTSVAMDEGGRDINLDSIAIDTIATSSTHTETPAPHQPSFCSVFDMQGWGSAEAGGASDSDDIGDVPEPIAAGAARLAASGHWPAVTPHALRPLYVRRPDVELARERGRPGVG